MADVPQFVNDLQRYRQLLIEHLSTSQTNRKILTSSAGFGANSLQIEQGEILAGAVLSSATVPEQAADELIAAATSHQLAGLAVVDSANHHRPVYRPLLAYAIIQAFTLMYETLPRAEFGRWEEGTRAWADSLEEELHQVTWPVGGMPASRGASACEAVWSALALHVAGKVFVRDAFTDQAADILGKLVRGQQSSGNFLTPGRSDNPETHWYHELVLLHAAASYAVHAEDRVVAAAVAQAAEFHQNETQPDHASGQPWGVFAFIWNPKTRPLAEQVMHSMTIQNPEGVRGVARILVADAVICLDRFLA